MLAPGIYRNEGLGSVKGSGGCHQVGCHRRPPHYGDPYIKGPKRQFFLHFFTIFSAVFPYIWPLAGPNIAEKGWPLLGRVWEGFGKAKLSSREQVGC